MMIGRGLDQFLVRLVMGDGPKDFRCFAEDFGHACEQALGAHPDGHVYAIHLLPDEQEDD
jgi:hypothetical protein